MSNVCLSRLQAIKHRDHFCFTHHHIRRGWHNTSPDQVQKILFGRMRVFLPDLPDMSGSLKFSGRQHTLNLLTLRKGTETRVKETRKEDIARSLGRFSEAVGSGGERNERRPWLLGCEIRTLFSSHRAVLKAFWVVQRHHQNHVPERLIYL